MRRVSLRSMGRSGLFPGLDGVAPIIYEVRATIPALEALATAGAIIDPLGPPEYLVRITLGPRMPRGIVAALLPAGETGIRLAAEQPYPIEYPTLWEQAAWLPCPKCGAPVVWYEAGYVPGYRVCAGPGHHHSRVRQSAARGRRSR